MILTRNLLLPFLLLLSCLGFSGFASAQTPIPPEAHEQTPPEVETLPPPASPTRNNTTVTLQPQGQERITNLAANISNRLDAYIFRLQNITDRFSSRMNKLESDGIDVTIARASLARAQVALDTAKAEMAGIDERVAMVTGGTDPRTAWQEVKHSFMRTRDVIKVTFDELRTVMIDLRGALNNPQPAAPEATEETNN